VKKFWRDPRAVLGTLVVLLVVIAAVFAEQIAPYDPLEMSSERLAPPSVEHLFGTDYMGRDVFSRVVYGARISLYVGIVAVALGAVVGVALGLAAGYWGGRVEQVIMRGIDVLLAFPLILLAILILAFFGQNLTNVLVSVAISRVPNFARLTHGLVVGLRQKEFLDAGRAIGAGDARLMVRYVLVNIAPSLIVYSTFSIPFAILLEAGLSFLGLGVQPPTPTWGSIISQGKDVLFQAPWIANIAGGVIMITVLAFNLLGEVLGDRLDPRANVRV